MLQNGCFIASLHFWAPGRKEKSVFLLSLLPSFLLSLPPSFLPPSLPPFLPSSLPSFLPSFFLALPPSPSFLPHPSLSLFVLLTFKKTVAFLETAPRTSAYILLSSLYFIVQHLVTQSPPGAREFKQVSFQAHWQAPKNGIPLAKKNERRAFQQQGLESHAIQVCLSLLLTVLEL